MNCPKCQTDNPEINKFCRECGSKLAHACPQCGAEILLQDKFCGQCGHDLTIPTKPAPADLSFDEKIAKIQRYLPEGLTEKILSQRDRIEGERKQVTVMFCDMEGFTALTERLGPEEAYAIMDQVYEILIHKVHDYEGTVNEMTGDGIVALFGAPIALEDAPQRAIRSAISIHKEMTKFSERMRQDKAGMPPLKMRIGIHSGPVVVGTLGNDLRVEFKAVGDTVNLASRMEELARSGTTCVTEETFKLTEGLFRFEGLGEKQVKGRTEPVPVYRVVAPSTRRTRFDVSAERGLTPFVGRERELELLLDAFERAKEGRGQAVSIVAGAGEGKSRLLYELRKRIANENVTFVEGKCLSYSRGVAYHPIVDILKGNFDIREGDEDSEIRDKVERGLQVLHADDAAIKPYLLELLSVEDSGVDLTLSPEGRKERTIQALNRIVLKGAEIRPLIMAVEDLHWMDRSSENVFRDLLDYLAGARVLLLFTHRTEYVHAWGARSYHSQATLNRLSNRETLTMVSHLLGTEEIPENLADLILEKTEGVPFFIEEFLKSLRDLKILERRDHSYVLSKDLRGVAVPSTIQDVLMARVDALSEGAKEVLQAGAAIEREFSHELIQRVTGLPERELLVHLSALKDSELLYERGVFPESTYIFKHSLVREVLYNSILSKKKRELHRVIGDALEDLHGGSLDEHLDVLAEHFMEGGEFAKSAKYSRLAGRKAERSGSIREAIDCAEKRIACLEELPQTDEVSKETVDARTTLGLCYMQMNYSIKAKDAVEPVIELAETIGYKKKLSQIYAIMGDYWSNHQENPPEALKWSRKALDIATATGDPASLFFGNYTVANALLFDCDFENAVRSYQTALEINEKAGSVWGVAAMKSMIALTHIYQGEVRLAQQISKEAVQVSEESGDKYSKAMAYGAKGASLFIQGSMNEAEVYLLKGAEFSRKIGYFAWQNLAESFLGSMYMEFQNYEKAKSHLTQSVRALNESRLYPSRAISENIANVKAQVLDGEIDVSVESLYEDASKNRLKETEGAIPRHIAEILLHLDGERMSRAEDWIRKAVAADSRNGMKWNIATDYVVYAEVSKRQNDLSRAREHLHKAIEIFQECGADGWVKRTEEKLAQL